MSVAQATETITEDEYLRLALMNEDAQLECFEGRVRENPSMSAEHNDAAFMLGLQIGQQLDLTRFRVRVDAGRTRHPRKSVFIPDVMVIPIELERAQRRGPGHLEIYTDPLPFVTERWSPSTGDCDIETKIPEYQERGDREIWRLHPYDKSLTAWRRRADGTYDQFTIRGGKVQLFALPEVTIDLDALFAE